MTPSAAESNPQSTGKCPVDHKNGTASSLWKVLGIKGEPKSSETDDSTMKNLPASLEEAAKHAQTPHPEQRLPLSTYRSSSTIPRGSPMSPSESKPHHQIGADDESKWVYPSEQQVFNAMKRKGWDQVEEESIPSFLQIHNSVNERSWQQLLEWESNPDVQLVRFQGRPNDLTPKAWVLSNIFFQEKPFDRHDWFIDNGVDHEKRYVLDFYMKESARSGMPRVEIDVRPALDTPQAVMATAQRIVSECNMCKNNMHP